MLRISKSRDRSQEWEKLFLEGLPARDQEAMVRLQDRPEWDSVLNHLQILLKQRLYELVSANPSRDRDVIAAEVRVIRDLHRSFTPKEKGDIND